MKALVIWTIMCAAVFAWIIIAVISDKSVTGTYFTFNMGGLSVALSKSMRLEAGACGEFKLKNETTGQTLTGELTRVPLGMRCAKYFTVKPTEVTAGTWTAQGVGEVTMRVTSEQPTLIMIAFTEETEALSVILFVALGVLVWIVGVLVGSFCKR